MTQKPDRSTTRAATYAQHQRYATLVRKLRDGETLTAAEAREIERLEPLVSEIDENYRWTVSSLSDVAAFFGVTRQALGSWIRTGCPRREVGRSKYEYDLSEIARWRHERDMELYRDQRQNTPRTRVQDLRAELMEIKLAKERGEIVETKRVVSDLRDLYVAARTGLLAAKAEFPPDFRDEYDAIVRRALSAIVEDLKAREGKEEVDA